jgi:hypothetical protein
VPVGAGSSQVFVEVRNFGIEETAATLTLSVDEEVVSRALPAAAARQRDRC